MLAGAQEEKPFGDRFPNLDGMATGEWWKKDAKKKIIEMDVPRDQVVAFALYTHQGGTLKLSAQLFPLKPGESREVRLELNHGGNWIESAKVDVIELGWSANFRIDDWDNTKDVPYRVRHGEKAMFEGLIRHDPIEKDVIVVGSLSCNSSRSPGERPKMLHNLITQNPDLLFFAGDQTYHHTQHTAGWLEFGLQFREVMKDRPVVTIPDDHDIGQANLWGESGKKAKRAAGPSGGYFYPPKYVNMVQRQQTWHLPDPFDPTPVKRGIGVYYTSLTVGGVDFAILEDRKFKSGPAGKIPKMGPRPDHINDPKYDRKSVDVEGLKLLGDRQLRFLDEWGQDWAGDEMKVVLSQTAFCGAVHLHGNVKNRLLADLDSNGWPQTGRNKAVAALRRVRATHLCGDQHLGVVVRHGVEHFGDGPYAFTSPALVNTIYGRWWHPGDEKAGPNPVAGSPLPWTGDFYDGLGNRISMIAYANPEDVKDVRKRGDGYGIARFNKKTGEVVFECWPRFSDITKGDEAQYPGWPVKFNVRENDGRKPVAKLPALEEAGVVQVIEDASGEVIYTVREVEGFEPPVYSKGKFTVKFGKDKPERILHEGHEVK